MKPRMISPAAYFRGHATDANFGRFGSRKYGGKPVWPDAPRDTMIGRLLATESRRSLESRGWDVDEMMKEIKE